MLLLSGPFTRSQGPTALANKGYHFYATKQFDSCEICLTKAIRLDSIRGDLYIDRAVCEIRLDEFSKAMADLKKALEINKDDELGYYNLACIYSLEHASDSALHYLDKALSYGNQALISAVSTDDDLRFVRRSRGYVQLKMRYQIR